MENILYFFVHFQLFFSSDDEKIYEKCKSYVQIFIRFLH